MTAFEQLSSTQKIRASLHRDVQAISTETCHFLGLEITKPAMEIVAELVYKKLTVYGIDLEAFAKHAKRSTINTEDVKLLVRRCPSLKTHLNALAPVAPISKEKKRKTITAIRQTETPKAKESETQNAKIQISKQRENEIQQSKQREHEILFSKQREHEIQFSQERDSVIPPVVMKQEADKEEDKTNKAESMIVDDLIDLTFD